MPSARAPHPGTGWSIGLAAGPDGLEPFELPPVPVSLLYPAARVLSASLRAFVDWMKAPLRASTSVR